MVSVASIKTLLLTANVRQHNMVQSPHAAFIKDVEPGVHVSIQER